MSARTILYSTLLVAVVCFGSLRTSPADAGIASIAAGYNLNLPPTPLPVPFNPTAQGYLIDGPLFFDPNAGPILKTFQGPLAATGGPRVISNTEQTFFPVDENFFLVPGPAPTPGVKDWHEIIQTTGWVWVPSNARTSLITRNGQPWPSTPEDVPLNPPPSQLDIVFDEITPNNTLDIHKGLTWLGTAENPVWGDSPSELSILILEYPTPEPASIVLAVFGFVALLLFRRRRA